MKITPLIASRFVSDGGSMFGLVPKPIWNKRIPADDHNAIPQSANVLLVEDDDSCRWLLDTGCGNPCWFSEKERRLHGMSLEWPLRTALDACGVPLDSIDGVILTHAHWDHAGGIGNIQDGTVEWTFPHARIYLHEHEWTDACSGDPLLYKSYPEDTLAPLRQLPNERRILISDAEPYITPHIRLIRSSGHTRGHSVVHIDHPQIQVCHPQAATLGKLTALMFTGDVCPTQHHLRMVFQTAYDTYPLDTRQWKQTWLTRAARERTALFFDHDPTAFAALIQEDLRAEFVTTAILSSE